MATGALRDDAPMPCRGGAVPASVALPQTPRRPSPPPTHPVATALRTAPAAHRSTTPEDRRPARTQALTLLGSAGFWRARLLSEGAAPPPSVALHAAGMGSSPLSRERFPWSPSAGTCSELPAPAPAPAPAPTSALARPQDAAGALSVGTWPPAAASSTGLPSMAAEATGVATAPASELLPSNSKHVMMFPAPSPHTDSRGNTHPKQTHLIITSATTQQRGRACP